MATQENQVSLNDKTPVRLPFSTWFSTLLFAFCLGGVWFSLNGEVSQLRVKQATQETSMQRQFDQLKQESGQQLDEVKKAFHELQSEQRLQRELLIRIDERVKRLDPKP